MSFFWCSKELAWRLERIESYSMGATWTVSPGSLRIVAATWKDLPGIVSVQLVCSVPCAAVMFVRSDYNEESIGPPRKASPLVTTTY